MWETLFSWLITEKLKAQEFRPFNFANVKAKTGSLPKGKWTVVGESLELAN
jgi:hypothetical protein